MKIGIIGTGWVAGHHLDAFGKIDGVEVAAIAGRNEGRGRELAEPSGAKVYGEVLPMLERESLDAVAILLPPHLHGELEVVCSEHVGAVLVEKPVSQSMEAAERAHEAFKRAGTLVAVGYMNRYRRAVDVAREVFKADGDPGVMAHGWWITRMPPPMWWRSFEQSGGQFVEQCTHLVDLSRYVFGEIVEVSAWRTGGRMEGVAGFSVDDAMVVNARFASGALGSFCTGCYPLGGHAEGGGGIGLTFSARQHRMVMSGWNLEGTMHRGEDEVEGLPVDEDVFVRQNRAFVEAVRTGDRGLVRSDYGDAMKTLAVTLAANESARERGGAPVGVD